MTTILNPRRNLLERRQQADISLATQPNADLATTMNLRYDYSQIAAEHRDAVKTVAVDIRTRGERAKRDILAIGKGLIDVKKRLPHGQFMDWCNTEFELTDRTARNLMSVYECFGDRPEVVGFLTDSVLTALAAPSVTERAREAVVATALENRKSPTKAQAEKIIEANTAKRGRPNKKPALAIIDSTATHVEKPSAGPGAHTLQSFSKTETAEYIEAQLVTALRVLPIYEQETGDAASAAELRQVVAKMLAKLVQE